MPNALASLALLIWPYAALVMFRRLPFERALIWSLLLPYLLLPPVAEFDLPLVPDLDKFSIASCTTLALCLFWAKRPVPLLAGSPLLSAFVLVFVLTAIPTVLTNGDAIVFQSIPHSHPIVFFNTALPGLKARDMGSVIMNQVIILIPYLIARRYLSTARAQRELLLALVLAALAYSVPCLIEIRFSPQINTWVYGFFQHDFSQMMRKGGFRPIVFMPHALWLALFVAYACFAAAALLRVTDAERRVKWAFALIYLFGLLYLCKSLASLAYALAFIPIVIALPATWQVRLALGVALISVIYPMLRNTGMVPLEYIMDQALAISADRAQSLGYRFMNEELMLARAADKPVFGWGGWGRNLVRDVEWGTIESVPDGHWIILFGTFGWVGYLAEMGLLTLPLLLLLLGLLRRQNSGDRADVMSRDSVVAACLALMLAATLIDMLLNDTLVPLVWLIAGSILGYGERLLNPDVFAPRAVLFAGQGKVKRRRLRL